MRESLFDGIFETNTVGAAQVAPIITSPLGEGQSLFSQAVLLNLRVTCFGTRRVLDDSQYEVDAAKEKTSAAKQICRSEELRAIKKYQAGVRKWVADRTIPGYEGLQAVKLSAIPAFEDYFRAAVPYFEMLVDRFIYAYPTLKYRDSLSKDAGGLGALYDERDYPDVDKVRAAFSIQHGYVELGAAGSLRSISSELYEREEQKIKAQFVNALEEGQALIRGQFASLVFHVNERLTPNADGKPKVFRDSLVSNIKEFAQTFSLRNYGDGELEALVNQLAESMEGVSPSDLRSKDVTRAKVQAVTQSIKDKLDGMLVDRPGRRINLDDELGGL